MLLLILGIRDMQAEFFRVWLQTVKDNVPSLRGILFDGEIGPDHYKVIVELFQEGSLELLCFDERTFEKFDVDTFAKLMKIPTKAFYFDDSTMIVEKNFDVSAPFVLQAAS